LRNLFKFPDTVTVIKVCTLEWLGRFVRTDRGRAVKTSMEGKPEGEEKKKKT
jgi:hypothetical protein